MRIALLAAAVILGPLIWGYLVHWTIQRFWPAASSGNEKAVAADMDNESDDLVDDYQI